jgi:diguanylate cyclase (GGDEF)-like protein
MALAITFLLTITAAVTVYRGAKDRYVEARQAELQKSISAAETALQGFAAYTAQKLQEQHGLAALMAGLASASDGEKQARRTELRERISADYEKLQGHGFRQLHFHLPDGTSFLRMHAPDRHGDTLAAIRPTLAEVMRTRAPVHGFEEGRIYNGYRNVFPIFHRGSYVGSMETSFSMQKVIDIVQQSREGELYFLMDRSVVESTVFAREAGNYERNGVFDNILSDRGLNPLSENARAVLGNACAAASGPLKSGTAGIFCANDKDSQYLVLLEPVRNLADEVEGVFVSLSKDSTGAIFLRNLVLALALISLLFLALGTLLFLLLQSRRSALALATHDPLTGLYNRYAFRRYAERELERVKRHPEPLGLLILDIDHFKLINDRYGHAEGDKVLKALASLLTTSIRSLDLVARWGGEEFVILLPKTDVQGLERVARKIIHTVETAPLSSYQQVTASCGGAVFKSGEDLDQLVNRADRGLYHAKQTGRNRFVRYRDVVEFEKARAG